MERPRTILYTGKGGVGKTSVAAATALRAAAEGRRVIVLSTDPAHSLSDSLGRQLGNEPTPVTDRLWGQEVRAQAEMERSWEAMRDWLGRMLARQGVDRLRAEELTVPPGMDELFALLQIRRHHESGEFDLIVVDCAPTGETLRLLGFPEVARWWIDKIFPRNRFLAGAARPLARSLDLPLPEADAIGELERLAESLLAVNAILRDRESCSIRLVLNPDRMVIQEAKRTFTYLCLYGFLTDAVIANRVMPAALAGGYLGGWQAGQAANLVEVEQGFAPVPVLTAPWLEREVIGIEMLARLGEELFAESDGGPVGAEANAGGGANGCATILHRGRGREIELDGETAVIRLPIPFTGKGDVDLKQIGSELIVTVGGERRTIILPSALSGQRPSDAGFVDETLEIRFEDAK